MSNKLLIVDWKGLKRISRPYPWAHARMVIEDAITVPDDVDAYEGKRP
jgi:hypothetical protein